MKFVDICGILNAHFPIPKNENLQCSEPGDANFGTGWASTH